MDIIGDVDPNRLFCGGSQTKLMTTFVCLSRLAQDYDLQKILDDDYFFEQACKHAKAKSFLSLCQRVIGSRFTLRDLCTFYAGLPYTFDLSQDELMQVEEGLPFKHHTILDEETFWYRSEHLVTPVYGNRCKFHYSEISIIFLGYLLENIYDINIEDLYQEYIINKFNLKSSIFSRIRPKSVYCQDLSDHYDYPAIAILDHGYFCYSNGFYTTLEELRIIICNLLENKVFKEIVNIKSARAASNRLLNGLTIEMRLVDDDIIYGYEGLSFSGCNIWAYSTKQQQGYLTFTNDEDQVYDYLYSHFGYKEFDIVPKHTQQIYSRFIKTYQLANDNSMLTIPEQFQGKYHRVRINQKSLDIDFELGKNFMTIRYPTMVTYDTVFARGHYCIKCKDGIHGAKIGLYHAKNGHCYFLYDGILYRRVS